MTDEETEQYIGGALIVLSLALLWCWYQKQPKTLPRRRRRRRYPRREGLSAHRSGLPDLVFNSDRVDRENMTTESMNDKEVSVITRHVQAKRMKDNVTGLRWAPESFVGGSSVEEGLERGYAKSDDSDARKARRRDERVVADVLSEVRAREAPVADEYISHSAEILGKTDYRPTDDLMTMTYGPSRGSVTI